MRIPKHKTHADLLSSYIMAVDSFNFDDSDYYDHLILIDDACESLLELRLFGRDMAWPSYYRVKSEEMK